MIIHNDRTVRSLKEYLSEFPDDAKLVIIDNYNEREVVIGANYEWQKENNTVQLMAGLYLSEEV